MRHCSVAIILVSARDHVDIDKILLQSSVQFHKRNLGQLSSENFDTTLQPQQRNTFICLYHRIMHVIIGDPYSL